MQPGTAVNIRGLPLYHLRRHGPAATKEGVSDIMDFFKVTTVIGRMTKHVDYVLDSSNDQAKYISRRHGRVIHKQNNQHYFHDDSMNGIYINNVKIADKALIQEGDLVTFGYRRGKKVKSGTRIEQPDSEYQFIFEKCNCSHRLLWDEDQDIRATSDRPVSPILSEPAAEDHQNIRATSDRPVSPILSEPAAEDISCENNGRELLHSDTSDKEPSSSETDNDKTTEKYADHLHVPSTPTKNTNSEISSKYVVVCSPISPARSAYLKDFGVQTSPVSDYEDEITSQDLIPNIDFETEMISQFHVQNSDKSQGFVELSGKERNITTCSDDQKTAIKTKITKSKANRQKSVDQSSKFPIGESELTVNTSEQSFHNQHAHNTRNLQSRGVVNTISNYNSESQRNSTMVNSENVRQDRNSEEVLVVNESKQTSLNSQHDMIDNNNRDSLLESISENITKNISSSDSRSNSDFDSALHELQNVLYNSDAATNSNNDNIDFDSLLSELENVVKNNVSKSEEKRKILISNLVLKFFNYREHCIQHQKSPNVSSATCMKPHQNKGYRIGQSGEGIKSCRNEPSVIEVTKVNGRNVLTTSEELDSSRYMREQNENWGEIINENSDSCFLKNSRNNTHTHESEIHTIQNIDLMESVDLIDSQDEIPLHHSNQITEPSAWNDPIIPQNGGNGMNSNQDVESSAQNSDQDMKHSEVNSDQNMELSVVNSDQNMELSVVNSDQNMELSVVNSDQNMELSVVNSDQNMELSVVNSDQNMECSGLNSDQVIEQSEEDLSQTSLRQTIQLLIHQQFSGNNPDNVLLNGNGVSYTPEAEMTESVNDSLLGNHGNFVRKDTENVCDNDDLNSALLRNQDNAVRNENDLNANVGHEVDEVDSPLSTESDRPIFLFKEDPITSIKVKNEEEFTSKCSRKSRVLPVIENDPLFNDEENTHQKEPFHPVAFSNSAEYLSDASSDEFPAAFSVTVGNGRVEKIEEKGSSENVNATLTSTTANTCKTEVSTPVKSIKNEHEGYPVTPKSERISQGYNSPVRLKISLSQEMKDKIMKQRSEKLPQSYHVQMNNLLMKFRSTNSPVKKTSVKKETEIHAAKKLIFQNSEIEIISADSDTSNDSLEGHGKRMERKKNDDNEEENSVTDIGERQTDVKTGGSISTETNYTKAVINRKLEMRKTNSIGKTTIAKKSGIQRKKKGRPQKRKKRFSSKAPKKNHSSNWLMNTFPKKLPFIPQLGDKVIYFRQGHQLYLKEVIENNVYQFDSEIFEPWQRLPYLRDQELVKIESINFEVMPPLLCNIRLVTIDPVTHKTTGESFQVIYHDMPNVIDFFVLKQTYDIAVKRKWKAGERFCSIIEDSWWTGTVISQEPLQAEYPDSMFQCYKVKWDSGETEAISPWDMEPITETRLPLSVGGGRPVNQMELKNLVYTPESKEWPAHGQGRECERIAKAIDMLLKNPKIHLVQTAIASTRSKVEYPVNLKIICRRLKNHFYRRLTAVKFDVNYMLTNAEKSLPGTDELRTIRILIKRLLTFISDEKCQDVNALVMASGSNESTQNKKAKKRKSTEIIQEEQPVTDNSDWIIECSKLLCKINESLKEAPAVQNNYIWDDHNCQSFESISKKLENDHYKDPSLLHKDVKEVFKIAGNYYKEERSFGVYFMIVGLSDMFEKEMIKIKEKYTSYSNNRPGSHVRFELPVIDSEKDGEEIEPSQGSSTSILASLPSCFPAPQKCFKQWKTPPTNEFRLNMKLEALDIRNPTSICIATVVGLIGPRLLLRLDGSDNMNDFYQLVDSSDIHPIGYCNKIGRMVLPPLGFKQSISSFSQFQTGALKGADITPEHCFKTPPPTPKGNYFEVGMKLEAVDKKNPALICPATIAEVKGDQILLSFDGWLDSFNYWCRYDSRDIFPIGWCKQSGLYVQPPGKKVRKGPVKKNLMKRDVTRGTPSKVLRRSTSSQDNMKTIRPLPTLSRSLSFPCRSNDNDSDSSEHAAEMSSSSGIDSGSEFIP